MTVAKFFLLGMVSAVVPPNVGGTLPTVISLTSCATKLPLKLGALAQTQPHPSEPDPREIGGLRNNKGQVARDLYWSANGFPKNGDKALVPLQVPISNGHAVCEFPDVNAGTYAVSVSHDENCNGKLDTQTR
jgi:uncharacterized protein (DUF2141 family)